MLYALCAYAGHKPLSPEELRKKQRQRLEDHSLPERENLPLESLNASVCLSVVGLDCHGLLVEGQSGIKVTLVAASTAQIELCSRALRVELEGFVERCRSRRPEIRVIHHRQTNIVWPKEAHCVARASIDQVARDRVVSRLKEPNSCRAEIHCTYNHGR